MTLFRTLFPLLFIFVWACSPSPEERYQGALEAKQAKNFDAFSEFFTPESRFLLKNMAESSKRARLDYLKSSFDILPEGEVKELNFKNKVALLTVKGRQESQIRMMQINKNWYIDVFSLETLWAPVGGLL